MVVGSRAQNIPSVCKHSFLSAPFVATWPRSTKRLVCQAEGFGIQACERKVARLQNPRDAGSRLKCYLEYDLPSFGDIRAWTFPSRSFASCMPLAPNCSEPKVELTTSGSFNKFVGHLSGVLIMRALPFEVCISPPDFLKLPYKDSLSTPF